MRSRFFLILLSVISFVVIATSLLHGEYLRKEKIELIDEQVRNTATALLDSELGDLRKIEFEKVEQILSEELGEERIGKFFVIRNNAGQILFESTGAKLLPLSEIPRFPKWVTIEEKGRYTRILNLSLPKIADRTLQVGVVIDSAILSPGYLSKANIMFTGAIVLCGLVIAWVLTSVLMRPIAGLSAFVGSIARESSPRPELPELPEKFKKIVSRSPRHEEFAQLLAGFDTLIKRVNRDYRVSRFWSYQMAHELKTPMAILEAEVAGAQRQNLMSEAVAKRIVTEIFKVSETITSFLSWAEVENTRAQKRLFSIRVGDALEQLKVRLALTHPGRLEITIHQDFTVIANVQHFEQCIGNLIVNALNYSPAKTRVNVEVRANSISISDQGTGIPERVLERIGEPFNKGESQGTRGTGLGLAMVQSLCRLYDWRLTFSPLSPGTRATVTFPEIQSEIGME